MAIDFPNTPTLNQVFAGPNGILWEWDGLKWISATPSASYAPILDPVFQGNPQVPNQPVGDADLSAANTAHVAAALAPVAQNAAGNVGRNLVHNGLFNVAQRGAGPWSVSGYTLDRWILQFVTDTVTINQVVLADVNRAAIGDEAAAFCLQAVVAGNAAAGALTTMQHRMEDVRRLAGKTVTVSFWAVAGSALKLGINMVQDFGTGGSPSAAVQVMSTGIAIQLDTSWARYTATIAVPSISSKTLGTAANNYTRIEFWYSSGATSNATAGNIGVQSGTIQLWGVQLEIGSVDTPLEKPDPQVDVANCRRFYSVTEIGMLQYNTAGGYCNAYGYFPVAMRAFPTLGLGVLGTDSNLATINVAAATAGAVAFILSVSATGTGLVGATRSISASADL
jgi:hypothetical protein